MKSLKTVEGRVVRDDLCTLRRPTDSRVEFDRKLIIESTEDIGMRDKNMVRCQGRGVISRRQRRFTH